MILAVFSNAVSAPGWQEFIRVGFGIPSFGGGLGLSLGATVFSQAIDAETESLRWVAWCFGNAARSLRKGSTDPRFGLIITLNRIGDAPGRSGFRQLQHRTTGPYVQQTGHRAARDIPLEGFRVDRLLDVVSGAGGRVTRDSGGFEQIAGGRAVRFAEEIVEVAGLRELGQRLVRDYRGTGYQRQFSWVDHYVLVEEASEVADLREAVWNMLQNSPDSVDVLLPDDVVELGDDRSIHFVAFPGQQRRAASYSVLTTDIVARYLGHHPDSSALDHKLRLLDSDRETLGHASILECLAAELAMGGRQYVAYDGDFYRVDGSFVNSVNAEVRGLRVASLALPCYQGGPEGVWNFEAAAQLEDGICLDRRLITVDNETSFEACDVATSSGVLIYAKRKGKSSTLTYVFAQAERACELLMRESDARTKLADEVAGSATSAPAAIRVTDALEAFGRKPPRLEVVFAILGDWHQRDLQSLPLLSKISLVASVRRLELLGLLPSVAMVNLCSRGN